jgi:hypothetical protein
MVWFQCDGCGETLKKAKAEGHMRGCTGSVSCVDCNKHFDCQSVRNHTTCVSEEERYQGALYKGPRAADVQAAGKGADTKQDRWMAGLNGIDTSKLTPRIRDLFERLLAYDNIPRKQKKFENFIQNSFRLRDANAVAQLWELFSSTMAPPKEQQQAPAAVSEEEAAAAAAAKEEAENAAKAADTKKRSRDSEVCSEKKAEQKKFKIEKVMKATLKAAEGSLPEKKLRKKVQKAFEAEVEAGTQTALSKDDFKDLFSKKLGKFTVSSEGVVSAK